MVFHTPKQTPELQYALAIVLSIAPTIFTVLRFRARIVMKAKLEMDDWLIVVSLFFVYLTSVFLIMGTALGYQGRHMRFTEHGAPILSDPGYTWFLKMLYAGQLSQIPAIGLAKVSVLLTYRRIFRGTLFNISSWVLIGFVSAWIVSFFFANLFECVPISRAFVNAPGAGGDPKCINAIPMYLTQVYSDMILDIFILALPVPSILKLRLPLKQKIAVLGIFLLGIITVLSSCAKMIIFNFVGHELAREPDISYFLSPIVYWPLIEASLQIVAACLTMLRPFIDDWRLIFWSASYRRRMAYSQGLTGLTGSNSARQLSESESGMIYKQLDVHVSSGKRSLSRQDDSEEIHEMRRFT